VIRVNSNRIKRVCQGDIFRNIEYIEYAIERKGICEISKILFPLVIVLTQDCDLDQDFNSRNKATRSKNQDKYLLSVIVAPLYNIEHIYNGEHLSELELEMQKITKKSTHGKLLLQNQLPRYHYLEFKNDIPIVPSVIDFKHYFTVNLPYLLMIKKANFICKVSTLYREDISHRFASFLSRIGLPPSF
jgi:hypothetical protein